MKSGTPAFKEAREKFHSSLVEETLTIGLDAVPSNADKSNETSVAIAVKIAKKLSAKTNERLKGQKSGNKFEDACRHFLEETFLKLSHLRPGGWDVRKGFEIAQCEQYAHLKDLCSAAEKDPKLGAALGLEYTIKPDIVVVRNTVEVSDINKDGCLIDDNVAKLASLRRKPNDDRPLLHASISCKWTIRSDRAQNARLEALNLVRNRKGHQPHIVVVTAEPLPSRLASIALGTGDIDCVYHFALDELQEAVCELQEELKRPEIEKAARVLNMMVNGKRLKDISDLPLDLAV